MPSIGAARHCHAPTGAAAHDQLARGDRRPRPGHRGYAHGQPVEGQRPLRRRLRTWHPPAREVSPEGRSACRKGNRLWVGRPPTVHSAVAYVGAGVATST
ncbi:hypothetical protein BHE74_00025912 [Ensete ventricosum]|nr:hypothetical protein BHE74_00025912 [Ensete ventricosum]